MTQLISSSKRCIIAVVISLLLAAVSSKSLCQNEIDSIAPSFTLMDISGTQHPLHDFLGEKLNIVVFWATWGNDSIRMLDDLQLLYNKYQIKGLSVIGVCVEQQVINDTVHKKIIDTVKRKKLTFPILIDHQLQTFHLYGIVAIPTTIVLDKNRKILYKLPGYPIVGRDNFIQFVEEQFEGKPAEAHHKYAGRKPDKKALRTFNMAHMEFAKGRINYAKKNAIKAANLDTLFVQPLLLLAEISLQENQTSEAANYIKHVLKIEPNSSEALVMQGLRLAMQDSASKAIEKLTNIIQKDSASVLAVCYLGYAYGMNGDLQRSLSEFKRAETLSKNEYRIPLLRAEVYKRYGKLKEAAADMLKAKELRKK